MTCERCKIRKASVFLTQMIEGEMHKIDLCEQCAKELGVSEDSSFSMADLLLSLDTEKELKLMSKNKPQRTCPVCGYTQDDLGKTGRLGCWKCYEIFEDALEEILKEIHKGLQHRGKTPTRQLQHSAGKLQLNSLEKELDCAIRDEKYEQAAWLRDQIRVLKEQD